jgi:glycosyltransferase involved in cell wall biosynthesis
MRIAILTSGRFWVGDLARELDALGHDVSFYSLVPPRLTRDIGLPTHCNRWLGPYLAPMYAAARVARGTRFESYSQEMLIRTLDRVASQLIGPCDLFIGMSGMCLQTMETVKRKYGAKAFLERGSRHILSQREILDSMPARQKSNTAVPQWMVDRELGEYDLADTIVVPSTHVLESFVEYGVDRRKLFRNPFGVDLHMFPQTKGPSSEAPAQIIMTGMWSIRKGCDVLVDAWRGLNGVRLLHVGVLDDAPLPTDDGFEHHPSVKQSELTRFYANSHVFALASREEGLALVQAQALASGLRVVCTDRTGGADLAELIGNTDAVTVVPNGNVPALREALANALSKSRFAMGIRDLLGPAREKLSWHAYGQRYVCALPQ